MVGEKMEQKRITCLLGAGAVIEIGGPTTATVTDCVHEAWKAKNGSDCIECNLAGNFEQRFHLLELLLSFQKSTHNPAAAVLERKPAFRNIDLEKLLLSCYTLLETVGNMIDAYSGSWKMNQNNEWFVKFWKKLTANARLDIVTLNYDTCMEQSLFSYEDGFSERVDVMGVRSHHAYRFHPEVLTRTKETRVMHLHGCIQYGMGTTQEINKYAFDDSFHDLYKYESYNAAHEHWLGHSNPETQAGETIYAGAIVTGLRKTEKILFNPYLSYHYEFQRALRNNHSLLLVGYSCGDEYINAELMRMKQMHGNRRRIVIISCLPVDVRNNWHPDPYCREWPTENEYYTLSHLMGCEVTGILDSFHIPDMDVLVSDDGCVRWYLCGFRATAMKYSKDIINFLTNKK